MNRKQKLLHISIFACIEVLMNLLDKVGSNSEISEAYKLKANELNKMNEHIIDQTFARQSFMSKTSFTSTCANRVETAIRRTIQELKL